MRREKSCSDVILDYLKANPKTWVKKVQLYVICEDWSPETVGRILRDLEHDETSGVKVGYYDGRWSKNLAQYSYGEVPKKTHGVIIKDGVAYIQ